MTAPANLPLSTISRLFRVYCSPDDASLRQPDLDHDRLIHAGLINSVGDGKFSVSERGAVYVEALRSLPLPQQKWVMPA